MKLESGANLWQQSLNASLANFNEANGALKANEIAHSEPLKLDRPNKDKARLWRYSLRHF